MVQFRPIGIQREEYVRIQELKDEKDFRYSTCQKFQNLEFAIDEINKSLAKSIADQGSLEVECSTQINAVLEATMSSLKEFRQTLRDIQTEFDKRESFLKQMKEVVDDKVSNSSFKHAMYGLENVIVNLREEKDAMRQEFNDQIQRLRAEFGNKISHAKKEILAVPSEIPNIRKILDQNSELIDLYYKNASVRDSTNEHKIMGVEKKIINLYELIKELKTSNQETS